MVLVVEAVSEAVGAVTRPPTPFKSDGCSGGMSWAWRKLYDRNPPWNGLCVDHDRAYWNGGTVEDRQWADAALLIAVAQKGYPLVAVLMWIAVRVGGSPWLPFPWRWAFGWPYGRGYADHERDKFSA